jgi:flavorubredoxin
MKPVEIGKNVYWVGALDWNVRDFHGYTTNKGTTYNAYLVVDEKIALFDTVKEPFKSDLIQKIGQVVGSRQVDYIIVNHVEPDHSSSLPAIMEVVKPKKILCTPMGKNKLLEHYHREDWPYEEVKHGQTIRLGQKSVKFIEARMLHWPDAMFSYLVEDRLLISSDAFGQHWCTSERFDDEVDPSELMKHATKYFANILLLYSPLVKKLISTITQMGLEINMIAPDHGLIWRGSPSKIVQAYDTWSDQKPKQKALIIYDTMWDSTEKMAYAIGQGLAEEKISVQLLDLKSNHRSDIMTEVLEAAALIFGSPTLNNGMLPRMADMLHYMRGLRPQNKIGAAFGSYGWSGEAVPLINQAMEEMKIKIVDPGIKIKHFPTQKDLETCEELGRKIGEALNEKAST